MKLCIVMDRYNNPYAGTESQVLKLVEGLLARGWEVRFAVFRGTHYSRSGDFPVSVEELGIGSLSNPASWLRVYRYGRKLRASGFAVVHVFFNDASVISPPMMRLAGVKTLISRRDMGFWYTGLYLRVLRLTGRFVNAVVCNSKAVAEITGRLESVPDHKLHVIYNGYPDIGPTKDCEGQSILEPELSQPPLVIGIVANLRPIKRIEDLVAAVGQVIQAGHHIELRVIGAGEQALYREQAIDLGIENRVHFLGSQSDPERFIQEFDIAVLCSETEGFSNAIIEYMRCGKPVICTDTGGNPEIVQDGVNGYLIPVGDVSALVRRICDLVEHPERRIAMGRASLARLADRYSLDAMLAQHIKLYRTIESGMAEA
ncbi:glycosyltransferase [Marinobacter sp. DUT-3]|uniref:glycosyltransferase n=1 Tax=Marinobacter sp. DUT-3 TaxID=3412036 RepID=UPI003D17AA49